MMAVVARSTVNFGLERQGLLGRSAGEPVIRHHYNTREVLFMLDSCRGISTRAQARG